MCIEMQVIHVKDDCDLHLTNCFAVIGKFCEVVVIDQTDH